MMKFFDEEKKNLILWGILVLLLLIIIFLIVITNDKTDCEEKNKEVAIVSKNVELAEEEKVQTKYFVDIKGAVKKPGVYEIDGDKRINDVVKLAGGLKSNASTKYLNLSKKISDEMVIYIYTESQLKKIENTKSSNEVCVVKTEIINDCYGSSVIISDKVDSNISGDKEVIQNNSESKEENEDKIDSSIDTKEDVTQNKISINNATQEELMSLNGIGESKAKAIIEYRQQNNGFKKLEDIMNVSGIGEAAYNKIKEHITL